MTQGRGRQRAAAQRLAELPEWQVVRVIKAVPDRAQLPACILVLREGKLVYMAVPKLAAAKSRRYPSRASEIS